MLKSRSGVEELFDQFDLVMLRVKPRGLMDLVQGTPEWGSQTLIMYDEVSPLSTTEMMEVFKKNLFHELFDEPSEES